MTSVRISAYAAISVDGYLATADGDLGWLDATATDATDYGYDEFMADIDGVAMGRNTYNHIAAIDPLPYGDRPLYVFTSAPPAPRPGVQFWSIDPAGAVRHWHDAGLRHVYVDGGVVVTSFLDAGLVDDLTLFHVPVLLGTGLPLFGRSARHTSLVLDHVQHWPSGMVATRYVRVMPT
jgi:dihydrofolate reductase